MSKFTTNWYIYRVCLQSTQMLEHYGNKTHRSRESAPTPGFRKALWEAVDEGLSTIGDSAKQQLYAYLNKRFGITKRNIPEKIDEFAKTIEDIFGSAVHILEIEIMEHLHDKIGDVNYSPTGDLVFVDYLKAASQS